MSGPCPVPHHFDAARKPRLGLIALSSDLTSEADVHAELGDLADIHTARIAFSNPTTPENLRAMLPGIGATARLLVPGVELAAVAFSCTSATVALGEEAIEEAITGARGPKESPGAIITPFGALRETLKDLGAGKVAFLAPYVEETAAPMAEGLEAMGFELTDFQWMGIADDRDIARLSLTSMKAATEALDHEGADAIFLSCTALPARLHIPELERMTGKPVLSSNTVMIRALAKAAGLASCGMAESIIGRQFTTGDG